MKLKIAIILAAILCIIGGICLFWAYDTKPIEDTVNYQICIYPDGSATISVDNIGYVTQLQEDVAFGRFYYLKSGTLIIPADGTQAKYEYPQRNTYY